MTDRQRKWYEEKLNAFCIGKGQRYALTNPLTFVAASLGIPAEVVIEDCRAAMSDFTAKHASDIRRGISSAQRKIIAAPPHAYRQPHHDPLPSFPDKVRRLIAAGGMTATPEDIIAISPSPVTFTHRGYQTQAFLKRLWLPDEYLHIEDSQHHVTAMLGCQLMKCSEWLELLLKKQLPGDIIGRNPYSGSQGKNGEGKPSFVSTDCIRAFRYALIEFDALPIPEQCAFWLGLLQSSSHFAPRIVSLVHSAGKSIHGLVRIDANRLLAPRFKDDMKRLFCADPDPCYHADAAGFTLRGGTRLAGARRSSNGEIQQLIYLAK